MKLATTASYLQLQQVIPKTMKSKAMKSKGKHYDESIAVA